MADQERALIVGAGSGLSASLARLFAREGMAVALAARAPDTLGRLAESIGARTFECDGAQRCDVEGVFQALDDDKRTPDVVVYNASYRTRGPLIDLDPAEVEKSIAITAFGAFLVAQAAVRRMLPNRHGAVFLTGASAGLQGYAHSAPLAMGKFALRGLAQSMARELSPQGIHVAHIVVDGGIRSARRQEAADKPDSLLDPDAIAASYVHLLNQPRNAWSWELEVRPWVENF
jgi:NAD(P)-dependent dehydrogenase (short-subunit alcohol dehydrogenase family)